MSSSDRRRSPREPADWSAGWKARYLVDDRPDGMWHSCNIVDLSLGGVALELFGPAPALGTGVRVELQALSAGSVGLQLRGLARNMRWSDGSCIQVGIEWRGISATERAALALLIDKPPVPAA